MLRTIFSYLSAMCVVGIMSVTTATAQTDSSALINDVDIAVLRQDVLDALEAYPADQLKRQFRPLETISPSSENSAVLSELITEGVISDYLKVLHFMSARAVEMKALREVSTPELRAYADIKNNPVKHLILHQRSSPYAPMIWTGPNGEKRKWYRLCGYGCKKVLIDGYADKITYVSYDPHTGDIIPDQIASFERTESCHQLSYGLPQLGLCFEHKIPDMPLEALKADGLHVYDKVGSPFWPKGFFPDPIPIPDPNLLRAMEKPAPAFEKLEHVKATNYTQHRVFGVKRPGQTEMRFLDHDNSCVRVIPRLPSEAMTLLKEALPGDDTYQALCHGERVDNVRSPFLRGWNMSGGDYNYAALLTPHEIEARLKDYYNSNGGGRVLETISKLKDHHPDYQTDIGHRLAPIVIDMAKKKPLGRYHNNNGIYKVLASMPHDSLSLYVEDLFEIVKRETDAVGCIDLNCSTARPKEQSALWKLAQIFNGGGAAAEPYLDKIQAANTAAAGVPRGGSIGGLLYAASCTGGMGPKMEALLTRRAYRNYGYSRDYKFDFHWTQALRMTSQSEKAREHIEDTYEWMQRKINDGTLESSWSKTRNLEASIIRTEKILKEWSDQTPYCPTREGRYGAW